MKGEIPISVLSRYFRVPSTQGLSVDYPGRDMLLRSRITNVSNTGVFITTSNPLPRGAEFDITFKLPTSKSAITATCIVRWSTAHEGGEKPMKRALSGMGLEFTKIGRREKKAVEKYVKEFLTRMRKGAKAKRKVGEPEGV